MIEIVESSGLVTIQDTGRWGWQKFGLPVSGGMDWFALRAANASVGNEVNAAVIEIGLGEATFRAHRDCVIAVTGAGYEVKNYVWTFPLWTSFYVRAGWYVSLHKSGSGNWAYLAAAGGFAAENILGSRSAYLRGNVGEALTVGTRLNFEKPVRDLGSLAARNFPLEQRPNYSQSPVIDVISGPQKDMFTWQGLQTFFNTEYTLSKSFDRMGYRLEPASGMAKGTVIAHKTRADIISEGMTMGSVQVPASGHPIVIMADGPTTGGYPKIANVTKSSLPVLAQCESGTSRMRFREVSVNEAQEKYKLMVNGIKI